MLDMTTEQKIMKNKVDILEVVRHLDNVSQVCNIPGHPRDSFYHFRKLYKTAQVVWRTD
jgi:hypothetical protein